MPLILHGPAYSTCAQRVSIVLREKNVPFELRPVDLFKGEHKTPEHLKRQPFGQVPYLEDDGFFLYESRAIALYIAKKYASQGPDLYPTSLQKSALVDQWISLETAHFTQHASVIVYELIFKALFQPGASPDQAKVAEHKKKLESVLDVYEKELSGRDYLAGGELSVADLFHLPYGVKLFDAGLGGLIEGRPNVKKWWERLTARQSWKDTLAAAK
ncbi:glutathione S-transferase III [Fimicolochytrium jonesii]|uniref:glutathione S-transferase III n=1 Tax=Fimicolochytrium jonesii TaxID=1396493 RepID=UPI0022FF1EC9|nr:glutathione S-transferase III [Fimicolochytrium jonesii]KAI8819113.1 glutathione S-transferase III [Fimicolochytrium jonesii]